MRQNAASAATWTLAAFAVQLIAGVCADMVGKPAGMALLLICWLMNGYAAYRLRCPAALGAAAAGAVLAALSAAGLSGWMAGIASNLLFLLFYQNKLFLLKPHQGIFIQFRFLNHLFSGILDGSVVSS